ncbi:TonB-dependent siderophore receptor [Microcoleus sp. FACHB-1515]|uniref:TonB-dependent siderophore receptor n=1 Tax=Cyanophyceae TaxID=3028117 RepID=UPI0016885152|nr:TonB-dependent siderophore receptor [Microcoleus sp. FACHB-1515]MBD2091485.1 TonB-dependent siderophore receptor [Microcoleus sp. FACHB-1515]
MNQVRRLAFVASVLSVLAAFPAQAEGIEEAIIPSIAPTPSAEIPRLSELEQPAASIDAWVAQIAQSLVQVTGVEVNVTEAGLAIALETSEPLQTPSTSVVGNALIVDIPNAVLTLADGDQFEAANPAEGIALVSVTDLVGDRVRVAITGVDAPPTASFNIDRGLVLAVTPGTETAGAEEDAIEVVVTGTQEEGYVVDNATTATRTDTPLRDIPQSISIIPQQVIEDQQILRSRDALRNVSGVGEGNAFGGSRESYVIRGFFTIDTLRNGFLERGNFRTFRELANVERIEVLRGPASVLFGNLEPGGIVNFVTELPLENPQYVVELQGGSFSTIRPSIDFTGPLNDDRSLRYRLNAVYERSDDFRDFDQGIERLFIAPVVSWEIGDRTDLILELEYLRDERPFDRGIIAFGDGLADIPFDRILGEPDDVTSVEEFSAALRLNHQLSDDWTLRNGVRFFTTDNSFQFARVGALNEATGELTRSDWSDNESTFWNYSIQSSIQGEFSTGSINHTLLVGVDLLRITDAFDNRSSATPPPPINIFDPEYRLADRPDRSDLTERFVFRDEIDNIGFYVQDQIDLLDNLILLVGGRFDIIEQDSRFNGVDSSQTDEAFTPRVGIVYQPIEPLSLYASFSQSFTPNSGTTVDGDLLEPERGTQFEIGARGELFDGRVIANLAAYDLTKRNIAVTDPNNTDFSIAIGEQRSRGIEFDVIGEIASGWNIIASYAHTDAEVTDDGGSLLEGNRLADVPQNSGSLWTSYELQSGNLEGLGFGIGLFFASDRPGNLDNNYEIPGYVRTDASIFYRRNNFRAAINIKNLFDIDYIQNASFGRTANPGTPLTILGSVSIEF